jgi:hypothetical protein
LLFPQTKELAQGFATFLVWLGRRSSMPLRPITTAASREASISVKAFFAVEGLEGAIGLQKELIGKQVE